MNKNYICVFDLETTGLDTETLDVIEVAAAIVHPRKLNIVEGGVFESWAKPERFGEKDYLTGKTLETLKWHAGNANISLEEFLVNLENAPPIKQVWKNFCEFVSGFGTGRYDKPISSGKNIINFDLKIAKRLCDEYKIKYPFSEHRILDLEHIVFSWFENLPEPKSLGMDSLRKFFKIPSYGLAHRALPDVKEETALLVRFLNFQRRQASVEKFKGSFAK